MDDVKVEQVLLSHENLDRPAAELWGDQNNADIISSKHLESAHNTLSKYATELDKEDLELIHDFGSLSTQQLMDKIKQLQNHAYLVGIEESKELTRGKHLHILEKTL